MITVLADSVSGERSLLGLQMAAVLLCLHTAQGEKRVTETESVCSGISSYEGTNLITRTRHRDLI